MSSLGLQLIIGDLYTPPSANTLVGVDTNVGSLCLQAVLHQITILEICFLYIYYTCHKAGGNE